MNPVIRITNLWLFYVLAYAIAYPLRNWANKKRGEPIEDPEFLAQHKPVFIAAMIWLFGGLILSLFVPLTSGPLFYLGLGFYLLGLFIGSAALYALGKRPGLVGIGVYRWSRNPNYVGWTFLIFGLTLMGWSASLWSILFDIYFLLTIPYFHWTVLTEEAYLADRFGASYRDYLSKTARYFGVTKARGGS